MNILEFFEDKLYFLYYQRKKPTWTSLHNSQRIQNICLILIQNVQSNSNESICCDRSYASARNFVCMSVYRLRIYFLSLFCFLIACYSVYNTPQWRTSWQNKFTIKCDQTYFFNTISIIFIWKILYKVNDAF